MGLNMEYIAHIKKILIGMFVCRECPCSRQHHHHHHRHYTLASSSPLPKRSASSTNFNDLATSYYLSSIFIWLQCKRYQRKGKAIWFLSSTTEALFICGESTCRSTTTTTTTTLKLNIVGKALVLTVSHLNILN